MRSLILRRLATFADLLCIASFSFVVFLAQLLVAYEASASSDEKVIGTGFSPLLVSLSINLQLIDTAVIVFRDEYGSWMIPESSFRKARVQIPKEATPFIDDGKRYFPLTLFIGSQAIYEEASAALNISMQGSDFEPTVLRSWKAPLLGQRSTTDGMFLNYDLFVTSGGNQSAQSLFAEWGAAIGKGVGLANIAWLRDEGQSRFVRLNTNYTLDDTSQLATWRFGDSVSRPATTLGRAVRFGGLQYTTNFQIQPGFVTAPIPTLSGQAALPAMVDLYVNNILQSSTSIPPGPFSITTAPVISGDGEVIVKVRDISGREEMISGRFYSSPLLLASGLSDFSFETGALRKNFGLQGDEYGELFGSASYRKGITERLTLEGSLQGAQRGPYGLLGGAIAAIPGLGTASAAAAISHNNEGHGFQAAIGFERRTALNSIALRTERASEKFDQIGIDNNFRIIARDSAFWSYRLENVGSLGLSYTRQQRIANDSTEIIGLSFSTQRSNWGQFTISALESRAEKREYSLNLFWILPLDQEWNASASHSTRSHASSTTVLQAQKSPPYSEGVGWRLQAAINAAQQAGIYYQHGYGAVRAEAASFQGQDSARLSLSGAIARIDEQWFATRRISGSYGLVSLPDLPNVRVYVDNQLMSRTDENGYALLPRLQPYVANHISIEQMDLPLDAKIDALMVRPVPSWRSGVIVNFPVKKIAAATLKIVDQQGSDIPAGAVVNIRGMQESFAIGTEGLAYLEGLSADNYLDVRWAERTCEVHVLYERSKDLIPYLGEYQCIDIKK